MNKDIEAEQVTIASPGITAAVVRSPGQRLLMASVYVAAQKPEMLRQECALLWQFITSIRGGTGDRVGVVLVGDVNRHDHL